MIGNDGCQHDIGKAEKHRGKQEADLASRTDDIVHDAECEQEGIEVEHHPDDCHHILHTVHACERHECAV